MIAAGQQFAAAVRDDVVHLAFWSTAEGDWRLACADDVAQLQEQNPILSCATCIEIADEEVVGDPPLLHEGDDIGSFLAEMVVTTEEFRRVARVTISGTRQVGTNSSGGCARELSTGYGR